jgi:uncharacterized membrane protein
MNNATSDASRFRQQFEAGAALCLVLLLAFFYTRHPYFLYGLLATLLVMMTVRKLLTPIAIGWFTFSEILGMGMSKVILGLIYVVIITPIGWIRRQLLRKDPMMLRSWNQVPTGFTTRNHLYKRSDLDHPF